MFDPYKIRKDFPMLCNGTKMQGHNLVFLDNASTTFKPQEVIDACNLYNTQETSNSHRGDYDLCYTVDKKIDEARKTVANFINADPNECVFTSGASMSLNLIAKSFGEKVLKQGDEILITIAEHASNILPWFEVAERTGAVVKFIPLNEKGILTPEAVENAITEKTKIVSLAHITNVLGYRLNIKEIAKICHKSCIFLVVDGAQSVPHTKTDVKDMDCDFLAFSGHKMLGPTGIGIMYGKAELLELMNPGLVGGGMNIRFDTNGERKYLEAPLKFEAGTQNIEGIFGLEAAIKYIEKIGIENIEKYEKELRQYAISRLKENKDVIIYNESADSGIITFNVKGVFAQDLATLLNSKGIACRSGLHCAKLLDKFLMEHATVRASLAFYNTKEDVDALVEALKEGGNFLDAYFA